jgi:hypothetical protein
LQKIVIGKVNGIAELVQTGLAAEYLGKRSLTASPMLSMSSLMKCNITVQIVLAI